MDSSKKQQNNTKLIEEKLSQLEKQLELLEEQLIRTQRLASIGTMTAMIAHEFNNILTPIVSYSQFALTKEDPTLWRKAVERAYKSGQEAVQICQQILSFARGEKTSSQANVAEIVQKCFTCLTRNPAKDKIKLELDIPKNLTVKIQPALLQQVLYNLILNARDAMLEKGGTLKISAQKTKNTVKIQVSDTGPGITPEHTEKIFQPFFTTKKDQKFTGGAGLGLAISKEIIEKANGQITFTSEKSKGTTFIITLPANTNPK